MRLIDADAFERRCMFDSNIEDMQDVIYALRDFPTGCDIEGIKAEIRAMTRNEKRYFNDFARAQAIAFECCLEIIDRHIKEFKE